ncbi:helix-turn-helix domain-containing protein [Streptomyces sp. NPDC056723]|uniref:helix-turn-helix domain-containing protein n=1 Tax=Streptomyces sp. NPDC056723 TaxID=3345925 RepID=UPI0036802DFD
MAGVVGERGEDAGKDRRRIAALGARIRHERQTKSLSLQGLADRSGVSRSMLSAIERGDKVPTVLVMDRIAAALGVSVSRLLDEQREAKVVFLLAAEQQTVEKEPGWRRSILSPVLPGVDLEFGRLEFEPYTDAGTFTPHQPGWTEYVAVESGTLEITLGGSDRYMLQAGDTLYYESDVDHAFRNPEGEPTVAYIVMTGDRRGA